MANLNRGEVTVDLGGRLRTIRFDFNAISELETMHNGTPIHVLLRSMGLGVLRSAFYCGLIAAEPKLRRKLTLEIVGDWLSAERENFDKLLEQLMEAVNAAMPVAEEDLTKPEDPKVPAPAAAAAPAIVAPTIAVPAGGSEPSPSSSPSGSTTPRSND